MEQIRSADKNQITCEVVGDAKHKTSILTFLTSCHDYQRG